MFDRLISGAGAVSHLAGRLIRVGGLRQRGASVLVGGLLGVVALAGIVVGLRTDDATLRDFTAGQLAAGDHGDRTFAKVTGSLASTYVETYRDVNGDGQHQADEQGLAWNYFLVDEGSKAGLTVQSDRPPSDIYTYRASGVVVEDATYLREDIDYFKAWLDEQGITLDPLRYIDATKSGSPTKVPIANGLPESGTAVEVEGSRSVNYLTVCSADTNDDGVCSADEIDLFDLVVYDPASKKGLVVLTANSPEFSAADFTGMLHRSPVRVAEAQKTDAEDFKLSDFGITVSADYLLSDGEGPTALGFLVPPAVIVGLLALVILIGAAAGYIRFRPGGTVGAAGRPGTTLEGGTELAAGTTLAAGERIPVHVTGELRTPRGLTHVREAQADLVRFVMTPLEPPSVEAPQGEPPSVEPPPVDPAQVASPTTLIIERQGRPEGVAVGRGELTGIQAGTVMPLRGDRPALRLEAGTGSLLVSFDSVAERDGAAAELASETGIESGGT